MLMYIIFLIKLVLFENRIQYSTYRTEDSTLYFDYTGPHIKENNSYFRIEFLLSAVKTRKEKRKPVLK